MDSQAVLVAILVGLVQGVFEWLPVSSEGNVVVALTLLGFQPTAAVQLALFVHAGTGLSALVYYREAFGSAITALPAWRPATAFEGSTTELSYLAVATAASVAVGLIAYTLLEATVSLLTGGAFVSLIGGLLVLTGVLQHVAGTDETTGTERPGGEPEPVVDGAAVEATIDRLGSRDEPDSWDAILVGSLQGLAVLPGVSRSGVTASALLLRGHDGPSAFTYSFLLSVPAALGAGALVVLDTGGIPAVSPGVALLATVVSGVVGYLTIDAMMRLVERLAFWGVCVGLGSIAIVGGVTIAVLQAG